MRSMKEFGDDQEDWNGETVKLKASRVLGPVPKSDNQLSKKRLRKVKDVNGLTQTTSSVIGTKSNGSTLSPSLIDTKSNGSTLSPSLIDTKSNGSTRSPSLIDTEIVRDSSDKALPPLDSFAFRPASSSKKKVGRGFSLRNPLSESARVKEDLQKSIPEMAFDGSQSWLDPTNECKPSRRRKYKMIETSDDDEEFEPCLEILPVKPFNDDKLASSSGGRNGVIASSSRGGNLVVDLTDKNEEDNDEAIADLLHQDETENAGEGSDRDQPERSSELDLIFATLQKCDRIAVSLRKELHPNSCLEDRYAEVDPSTLKIVRQADVSAACGIAASDAGQVLKPYQLVGVNFMMLLNRKNVGGAILADEMGLGKTVQAVAFLALLKHLDKDPGPHLIVCPSSLLDNWHRELSKWCPSFDVVMFHGNERAGLIHGLQEQKRAGKELPFNVMLTTYTLFERRSAQQKDDRVFLRRWKWSCVLLDEAHLLKDRGSLRTRRLRDLAQKARQRVMLTGTPLQNDLQELWSLLEFLMPDIFDTGKTDLSKLLGNRKTTENVLQEDKNLINHMKAILGPFVLRRLKTDVMQQLVPKIHKVEVVAMVSEQAIAYQEAVSEYRDMTVAARASRKSSDSIPNDIVLPRRQIQNIFTQLRKVANHPLLVRRIYSDQDVEILAKRLHAREVFGNQCTEERVLEELKGYNDFTLYQLCLQNELPGTGFRAKLTNKHPLGSAKCQILATLLPELREKGHRPLIFSQWTQMLDILEWALDVMGFSYVRLDGSTQVRERQEIVDSFNNDSSIFIFLLSTRAGGQGLNLTGADTVVIHDVDFNPQMDRQAEDRCHRIGQPKPVTVYRLVTKGSVDESIYNIAQRKLVLDAAVLESGGAVSKENGDQVEGDAQTMEEILSAILAAVPS